MPGEQVKTDRGADPSESKEEEDMVDERRLRYPAPVILGP